MKKDFSFFFFYSSKLVPMDRVQNTVVSISVWNGPINVKSCVLVYARQETYLFVTRSFPIRDSPDLVVTEGSD